jgi:hypothetical protein
MKKIIFTLTTLAVAALTVQAQTTVLSNDFGTNYTDGNLIGPVGSAAGTVGQNGWTQTGAFASGSPITISNGQAVLPSASGQDGWKAFTSVVSNTAGNYMLTTVGLTVTNATLAGDYFFHLSSPTNTTSAFFQRLWARTNASGQLNFGLTVAATNASTSITWGSTAFSLNTTYAAVMKWDFISGISNDIVSLFIDPIGSIETWTPEASVTWNSATAEPANLAAANLRIGGGTTTPGVLVDSIEVQLVPEPSTYALLALSGLALAGYAARRRRR